ncbi:MAG: histidinol-phosphate transaminase [Thermodesulfobacteriota bacterium]|nr:histidinol-phosphate transaminase [Thermodesulfobacteriota bacterium]
MFEDLVSKDVASLVPYPPGKPLEELERELGISGAVKLASNENPLGPSPKARSALTAALPNLHRYPDGRGYYLKQALAEHLGVEMAQIVLGNGSNEIIELCVRTFLGPGHGAVFSDPTFLVYAKVVQGAGGGVTRVPLKNFRHDLSGLARAVTGQTRLVFLDNPNNPTGALVPPEELKSFMADLPRLTILVLDEAYRDFVREGGLVEPAMLIEGDRPVIMLRTFSKAYGLAGLRVGYGLAQAELVGYLDRVRQPFNVNTLAQAGALAALDDEEFYQKTREVTWSGMDWLRSELDLIGLKWRPSQTNFFLIDLDRPADEVAKAMLHEGVIIRSMKSYGLEKTIRINVGLPGENERFIQALKKTLGR